MNNLYVYSFYVKNNNHLFNRLESNDEKNFLIEYCSLKGYELKYINHDFTRNDLEIFMKKKLLN